MSKEFDTKVFNRKGKKYIGVYKKGHKGFYSVFPYGKMTKAEVQKTLKDVRKPNIKKKRKQEITKEIWRLTKAIIYKYDNGNKFGQIRINVYTFRKSRYTNNVMESLLLRAEKYAILKIPEFRRVKQKLKTKRTYTAKEQHIVDFDEFKRSRKKTDIINIEVAGMGVTRGSVRTVNLQLK